MPCPHWVAAPPPISGYWQDYESGTDSNPSSRNPGYIVETRYPYCNEKGNCMDTREEIQKILDNLAQQRDELIVQAHLAKLEAMEEWESMEGKLTQLRTKAGLVGDSAEDTARNVKAAAKQLAEEIARGYDRIRNLF